MSKLESLVEAEKESMTPPIATAERGWKALSQSVALNLPPRVDLPMDPGVGVGKAGAIGAALWAKGKLAILAFMVAGATGVVAVRSGHRDAGPTPSTTVVQPSPVLNVARVDPEPVAVNETPRVETPPAVPARASSPAAASAPSSNVDFERELGLIGRIQQALSSGKPADALAALDDHQRQFPRGQFAEDRSALRALALCASGRAGEGRTLAQAAIRRAPRSVYVDRLRASCLSAAP